MNKSELVAALMAAGLRPEDLTEEYARATKENKQLEKLRSELVTAILNYTEALSPENKFNADDAKHLANYFKSVEQKRGRFRSFATFLDEME